MPTVHLRLLGAFSVTVDGNDATPALSQPKRLALVSWLALTRPAGLHRRDTLCGLLWPESPDDKARAGLRQLLLVLRRELSDRAFIAEGDLLGIDRTVVSSDAGTVLDALAAGDDATAFESYAGELLPGLHVSEGEAFERWFDQIRADLRRGVAQAGWRLVERARAAEDFGEARRLAERTAAIAPDDETGLGRLIRSQAEAGDRAAALQAYESFSRRLREDWATEPDKATQELAARIRTGGLNLTRPPADHAAVPQPAASVTEPPPTFAATTPPAVLEAPARGTRWWPWLAAVGLVAVGAAVVLRPSTPDATLVAGRVLVPPFTNLTGDARLDAMGIAAADWVIQGLQRSGIAEVVDPATAFLTTRAVPRADPGSMVSLRDLARGTRAGLVVVGTFSRVRDSIEYSARLADTRNGRVIRILDPVRAPADDPGRALEELRSRLAGAVATETDTRAIPLNPGDRPPRLEAYQEFVAGLEAFVDSRFAQAAPRLRRASDLDSSFTLAMMWEFYAWANGGFDDSSRRVVARIARRGNRLGPREKAWLRLDSLQQAGAPAPALLEAHRAVARLSPASDNDWNLANFLAESGRLREALEIFDRFDLARNWLTRWDGYWVTVTPIRYQLGGHQASEAALQRARRLQPENPLIAGLEIANWAGLGNFAAARRGLDSIRLEQTVENGQPLTTVTPWTAATIWITAEEYDAHGHLDLALELLDWAEPWVREHLGSDTTTEARIELANLQAVAATLRGDRRLAATARITLESVLDLRAPGRIEFNNARAFGYITAVCAEGDPTRIAGLPGHRGIWHDALQEAQIAACRGDREAAMRILSSGSVPAFFIHLLPALRPLRQDPRFQQLIKPKD